MKLRDLLLTVLLATATVILQAGCVRTIREEDLFLPRRIPLTHWARPPVDPDVRIIPLELSPGRPTIRGWAFSPRIVGRMMVYFYGNGETVAASERRLTGLASALRCEIVAFDYRGYGFSEGRPSFDAVLADGLSVYDCAANEAEESGLPLFVYGRSIGATIAVHVADSRRPSGMILEAPPTSAADVIPEFQKLLPVPLRWLIRMRPDDALAKRRPQPVQTIANLTVPLMIIHGGRDRIIPIRFGRRMYEEAGSEQKRFLEIPDAGHNDLNVLAPAVIRALRKFQGTSGARPEPLRVPPM